MRFNGVYSFLRRSRFAPPQEVAGSIFILPSIGSVSERELGKTNKNNQSCHAELDSASVFISW
jgi:hypothetical protein